MNNISEEVIEHIAPYMDNEYFTPTRTRKVAIPLEVFSTDRHRRGLTPAAPSKSWGTERPYQTSAARRVRGGDAIQGAGSRGARVSRGVGVGGRGGRGGRGVGG